MAELQSQQENRKSILDDLEQINKELDELEKEKKESVRKQPKKEKNTVKSAAVTGIVSTILLVAAVGVFVVKPYFYTDVRNTPVVIQKQDDYSVDEAVQAYQMIMDSGYSIDGVTYQFDSTLQQFTDNGWTIKERESDPVKDQLDVNEVNTFSLKKNGYVISSAGFLNDTEDGKIAKEDATMDHIYCYDHDLERVGPLGIKLGMSSQQLSELLDKMGLNYSIEKDKYGNVYYQISTHAFTDSDEYYSISVDIGINEEDEVRSIYFYTYKDGISRVISFS